MNVQVSKFLSLILRHKPQAGGLTLDFEGWAPVEDVLAALGRRFGPFSREALERLVEASDKQRFAFDPAGDRIRANQGHSVAVDLGLAPAEPPALLFHGTTQNVLASILAEGLVKGRRHHVHLSADVETARKVGARRAGETVILGIGAAEMEAAGHAFFRSANGVWLTDRVPPSFLHVLGEALSTPRR